MTIDMSQFFQVFFEEAEELLAEMEKLLLALDVSMPETEDLNAIFRCAHSIKGGASTFGITELAESTHVLETLLDRIRKGEMALTSEHVEAFLAAKDMLKMQLDGQRHGSEVDQAAVTEVRQRLHALAQQQTGVAKPVASSTKSSSDFGPSLAPGMHRFLITMPELSERDIKALADEIGLLGQITQSADGNGHAVFTLDTEEPRDSIVAICSFVMEPTDLKIEDVSAASQEDAQGYGFFDPLPGAGAVNSAESDLGYGFFDPLPAAGDSAEKENAQGYGFFAPMVPNQSNDGTAEPGVGAADHAPVAQQGDGTGDKKATAKRDPASAPAGSEASASIRVGIEKVDQLINLVGELVITQAMIEQRTNSLDPIAHQRLLNSVGQLTRNTRALQEAVMSIRMMPMDYVFSRFPRMVRDLANKLGKKVELMTHGAATELDKGLIERIVDPLTHLVRNSVDHGIEMPAVRKAAGKSETGRLTLSAAHQGGNIIIEVTDDGGGLNRDRILAKAKQQSLPVSDTMPDADVWQLIFAPGFSTAEAVTDISGRGVGMDVVKRNITSMGGTVDIRSLKGFGTTISISLPLTLAILDGMSVRSGEEIYILPLSYVVESLQPAAIDVKDVTGQGKVIKVRGEYLPLIPLYQIFNIEPRFTDPSKGILVILESEGKKAALFIDELVGQQQVVVKNLESNYRRVAGISGATILGDGGVALIIDVAALLRSSRQLADETIFS